MLVVGGAPGTTGAPVLAAMAALRADAGYVTLAVPRSASRVVETLALEPVKRGFDWDDAEETTRRPTRPCAAARDRAGARPLAPRRGRSSRACSSASTLPVVVDADALFGLEPVDARAPTVLTPHAGELARLLDADSAWVDAHRLEAAAQCAERFGAVVLLKGADTIVQAPDGRAGRLRHRPAVARDRRHRRRADRRRRRRSSPRASTPVDAAAAAAAAHGLAARAVPHQAGLVACDVVAALPSVLV